MKVIHAFGCCLLLISGAISAAQAGGGLIPQEITDLVSQNPELWAFLTSTLDISNEGWGRRIGNTQNKDLAGTRIPPYRLQAKPKGTEGPYIYELELQGTAIYFDKHGRKTTLQNAASLKMTFTGVDVRKLTPEEQAQ